MFDSNTLPSNRYSELSARESSTIHDVDNEESAAEIIASSNGEAPTSTSFHDDDVAGGAPGSIMTLNSTIFNEVAEATSNEDANHLHHYHYRGNGYKSTTTTTTDHNDNNYTNDDDLDSAAYHTVKEKNNDQQQSSSSSFVENKQAVVSTNNHHDFEIASWSRGEYNYDHHFDGGDDEAEDDDDESDIAEVVLVENPSSEGVEHQRKEQHHHQQQHQPPPNIDSKLATTYTAANPHHLMTTSAPSTKSFTSTTTAAMESLHARNHHMPQWMIMAQSNSSAPGCIGNNSDYNPNYHQVGRATTKEVAASAYNNTSLSFHNRPHIDYSGQQHPHHQQHIPPSFEEITIPASHTPTWSDILPKSFCFLYQRRHLKQQQQQPRKKLTLSLINVWEFTITIEPLTMFSSSYNYGSTTTTTTDSTNGLRAQIKRIAREHIGRDGRRGAIFERSGNIGGEDPMLKESVCSATLSELQQPPQAQLQPSYLGDGNTQQGKWRIPLGAYYSLMTYLTTSSSCSLNYVVEGIPSEQLRVATLGRERMDKKSYVDASELISRNVVPTVCAALAPYQRGGVEFMLDREGCALLADEMGLGKTLMAIAAMSAYREHDWPLLVLCPSSARYHWEMEFRHWMGVESRTMGGGGEVMGDGNTSTGKLSSSTSVSAAAATAKMKQGTKDDSSILTNDQITVLTSGRDVILKRNGSTRVVICSIGLIVNLVNSNSIQPGMFKAIVVDESHVLKSKTTKRTMAVLPLLTAARRCLLLSGTPAFARPAELWPQLSVLRSRGYGTNSSPLGIWCDEDEFMSKYVKGKGEDGKMTRLAELHTLLTSTVMIRRMKADILKNMPSKLREKAYINIKDETMRNDFLMHMQLLRQGRGVLGKLARRHCKEIGVPESEQSHVRAGENGALHQKEVLHHLYKISGQSKVPHIAKMLKIFLSDPANGKLCIFAHHLGVLDNIGRGAGLSNALGSTTRFIRIDGSTSPKARQEQILTFQTDPAMRVALLGITAAGVAVTLTASSTVWFAELFWTPAIMIQAEDRCHRIGQQAQVRCLYYIAKATLDEILWKLIEQKFREIGEFVDGKENMGIALERELDDGEDEAILKLDDDDDGVTKKRKSKDMFSEEVIDTDDPELRREIEELCFEEEDMFDSTNEKEEDELDDDDKASAESSDNVSASGRVTDPVELTPSETVIEILDEDDDTDIKSLKFSQVRELHLESGVLGAPSIGPQVRFDNLRIYSINYHGPSYGFMLVQFHGRIVVKSHHLPNKFPTIGAILVGVNGVLIPHNAALDKALEFMRRMMQSPPFSVIYAEDNEFTSFFNDVFIPNVPHPIATAPLPAATQQNSEIIELLDDD